MSKYKVFAFSEDVISIYNESNKNQNFKLNDNIDKNFDTVIIFLAERNQKTLDVKFFKNGKMLFIGASYSYGEYPIFEYPIQLAGATQPESKEEILFRVGDRVFQYFQGWGTITDIDLTLPYPITIKFDDETIFHYTINDTKIPLSFTEYNFITGGWSQERLPEIGSFGWFWADEYDLVSEEVVYGKLQKVEDGVYYTNDNQYNCFSTKNPF